MDIKRIIKQKGFTLQQVADLTGVNRVTLTLTIQGNPTYRKLKEISEAIGCDVADFFEDERKAQPEKDTTPNLTCPRCGARLSVQLQEMPDEKEEHHC